MKPYPIESAIFQHPAENRGRWHIRNNIAAETERNMPTSEDPAQDKKDTADFHMLEKGELFHARSKVAEMIMQHIKYTQLLDQAMAEDSASKDKLEEKLEELTNIKVILYQDYCGK